MTNSQVSDQSTPASAMKQRWLEIAEAITKESFLTKIDMSGRKGSLTVLGSGIMNIDMSIDVEKQITEADFIFYCVNDYVSKNWINLLRPDAYDLTILYSDMVDRHATYTCMAEAVLYHVRQGRRVVAIFYGHPGVFAAPSHRAIHIARKEGHVARMRPGISALDCLVADIGFDPALPGMVMYEATDMLLRRRRLDPSLHNVIWQVGVVGEFGYCKGGYENRGFDALVDFLEVTYGPDWPITHYIGAQYVGVTPHINQLPIERLREASFIRELGTLSTFYIAPKDIMKTDVDMANRLGTVVRKKSVGGFGDYTSYGVHEESILQSLFSNLVNSEYDELVPNAVLEFLTLMSHDLLLRDSFERDPTFVLNSPICRDLNEWEKSLLLSRQQKAFVAALNNVPEPELRISHHYRGSPISSATGG